LREESLCAFLSVLFSLYTEGFLAPLGMTTAVDFADAVVSSTVDNKQNGRDFEAPEICPARYLVPMPGPLALKSAVWETMMTQWPLRFAIR
jgi:hypothetical protein